MESVSDKLGICLICGKRVFSNDRHVEASEGYCHNNCLAETGLIA